MDLTICKETRECLLYKSGLILSIAQRAGLQLQFQFGLVFQAFFRQITRNVKGLKALKVKRKNGDMFFFIP